MDIEIETTIKGGLPVRAKCEFDPPCAELGEHWLSYGYIELSFLDGRFCTVPAYPDDMARITGELIAEYRRNTNE